MKEGTSGISVDYTLALLARLDVWLQREVIRFRLTLPEQQDEEYRGLYISDQEVDGLLKSQLPVQSSGQPIKLSEEAQRSLDQASAAIDSRITSLKEQAQAARQVLRFDRLLELFGLSEIERQILLICLAPELDLKYERLYAYLQDDVTKKRPTLDLVMRLLCPTMQERLNVRGALDPGSALLDWELLTLHDDPGARRPSLPARYLKIDDRIARYLLGGDQIDGRLLELIDPQVYQPPAALPEDIQQRLALWASGWERTWKNVSPVIMLHGRYGSGRHAAVIQLANAIQKPFLMLSMAGLPYSGLRAGPGYPPGRPGSLAERWVGQLGPRR